MLMEAITQLLDVINGVQLFVRREDLLHPVISGNKYRKLKYTLAQIILDKRSSMLTFGGAHSNHILAAAYAANQNQLRAIGVIRGDELIDRSKWGPTLQRAHDFGMHFEFVSRADYRHLKNDFNYWRQRFPEAAIVPEGGTSALAVKGCSEILLDQDEYYDYVVCAVGTGGTLAGLSNARLRRPKILGVPVIKGDFLTEDIRKFAVNSNWELLNGYEFGGYGKITTALIAFMNTFYQKYQVPLDPVYTGKAMFAIDEKITQNYFPKGSKVLFIHTGGLQGISAMNTYLSQKNQTLIDGYV
jgi:1-aminocyclopropane-1-carboxylate deaminase